MSQRQTPGAPHLQVVGALVEPWQKELITAIAEREGTSIAAWGRKASVTRLAAYDADELRELLETIRGVDADAALEALREEVAVPP